MQGEWQTFLIDAGATFGEAGVLNFKSIGEDVRAAANTDVVADLSHLALIKVHGPDAQTFLQGQLTNDLRQLSSGSQLSAYCTAQGRALAIFRIFPRDDAYFLQLPSSLLGPTLKRLKMFVLRAKATLEPADDLARIGFSGPHVASGLIPLIGPLPDQVSATITSNETTVIRLPGPYPRFEVVGPPARLADIWRRANATPIGMAAWSWLDIQAGLPTILPQTVEAFVPQMTNLDLLAGISFNKGCYPGQEIVARTRYLGKLKQRMYGAHVESALAVEPGMPLFAPNFGEQAAGTIVDAQPAPEGGYDLLAVIQTSSAQAGEVRLAGKEGPRIAFRPLPYLVEAPG